jgi:hypothetical protein
VLLDRGSASTRRNVILALVAVQLGLASYFIGIHRLI